MNVSATRLVLLGLVVLISGTEPAAAGQNFAPSRKTMAEAEQRVADAANSLIGSGQVQQALADAEKAEGGQEDAAETDAADESSADESAEATADEDTQATADETADEDTQAAADEDTPADEESSDEDASDEE